MLRFFGGRAPLALGAAILLPVLGCTAGWADPAPGSVAPSTDRAEIVHVLNRITFGPRPGDVEAVEKMGLRNYIEQQLHPETIDDSAVEQELQSFVTLQLSAPELTAFYKEQQKKNILKQLAAAKAADAANPAANGAPNLAANPNTSMAAPTPGAGAGANPGNQDMALQIAQQRLLNADSFAAVVPPGATPEERQAIVQRLSNIRKAPIAELADAKLIRAVDSNRQLNEVLVDFWTNHFNIDMRKGPCRVLKVVDDRETIRPHVFGTFHDLLEATAKSPAMLVYLDNALNTVGRAASAPVAGSSEMQMAEENKLLAADAPAANNKKRMGGINENYAREIMELHTLGVDGGYTQADVQEVARCFTGWSVDRQTGEFRFYPRRHDEGSKVVLGRQIPAGGGMEDGEMVLDILASAPATAHFISYELCQRFVSDNPPKTLVDRVAGVFTATGGDLRRVYEAILTSPEFLSPSCFGAKIKSPLEFTVSAVRATDSSLVTPGNGPGGYRPLIENAMMSGRMKNPNRFAAVEKRQSLNYHIFSLGEPLFDCIPPTGYKEISSIWVSPGALIERLNFAMALTEENVSDVRFDARRILGGTDLDHPQAILDQCTSALLPGGVSDSTRKVLVSAAVPASGDSRTVEPSKLIALVLGSPEFQRK